LKQLSGLDAAFLYMETPTTYGHVTGLMTFERPGADFDPFRAVYDKYASLVGSLEPLRRRVVEVPFGLDHPYWVNDPRFDLDFHIRELNLARPGRPDQLTDQVARIIGRPMDRSRPLWEVYVIDGLDDGNWALLTKYHHATIDGASGQLILQIMTDTEPNTDPPGESLPWEPDVIPRDSELLSMAIANLARNPVKAVRTQARFVRTFADAAGLDSLSGAARQTATLVKRVAQPGGDGRPKLSMPLTPAPPTPWNKSITPHRRFAMRTGSLDDIKEVKDATGCTVNDVVMAVCAGALREYLIVHDALPERPLRAMVPVSIRTGSEDDPWTNRVSSIFAELPTDSDDPLIRLQRCHEAMLLAKRQFELVPADALIDLTRFSPPVLATAAMRLVSQQRLADRIQLPFNLVISNVPGPRQPIYFAGAKMRDQFPISIVTDGQGLNVTVQSYLDRIGFGFIVDRDLVPDVWDLADLHLAEIDRLVEASDARRSAKRRKRPAS
jgi:diacylglycerol O-acyltransferase / wax synthase